jgi:hypothetical protein
LVTPVQEMRWVLRAQCRDRDALEALLRSVQPLLRRYLAGVAGTTDADDLLQDVLAIIIRKLGALGDPARCSGRGRSASRAARRAGMSRSGASAGAAPR